MTSSVPQATAPKLNTVNFLEKLGKVIEADHHQKVILKFAVTDKGTNERMKVHQVSKLFFVVSFCSSQQFHSKINLDELTKFAKVTKTKINQRCYQLH
jgi:hypothetical protein